jgi:hypothetical protein
MRSRAIISATMPRYRTRRSKLQTAGRVCAVEQCSTILSRYNASRYCSVHEPIRTAATPRGRRVATDPWIASTTVG